MLSLPLGHVQDRYNNGPAVHLNGNLPVSPLDPFPDVRERHLHAFCNAVIVLRVLERKRENAEVAEIRLMDAGEALHDLGADPEIPGRQGRVLAARSLAVVLAANDDYVAPRLAILRELRLDLGKDEVANRLDIGPEGKDPVSRRHDSVC